MYTLIAQLIMILSREAAVFERFLELLQRQKSALVANDAETLRAITEQLRDKVAESRLLDRERQDLLTRIRAVDGLDDDLTVTRLVELADSQQAGQLQLLRETIADIHGRISEARTTNELLLNQAREYVAFTMKAIAHLHSPEPVYSRSGETDRAASAVAVDRRI